jgi:hypothetical protein
MQKAVLSLPAGQAGFGSFLFAVEKKRTRAAGQTSAQSFIIPSKTHYHKTFFCRFCCMAVT